MHLQDYSVFPSRKITVPSCSLLVQNLFQGPQILKALQSLKNTKKLAIKKIKPSDLKDPVKQDLAIQIRGVLCLGVGNSWILWRINVCTNGWDVHNAKEQERDV